MPAIHEKESPSGINNSGDSSWGYYHPVTKYCLNRKDDPTSFVFPGTKKVLLSNPLPHKDRNLAIGATIRIPAKAVVKMRIVKEIKETISPGKGEK